MQKEQLSALMDGELIDNELINFLSRDNELQQHWYRYHLIRDTLRGDVEKQIYIDVSAGVFAAIGGEDSAPIVLIPEAQPKPEVWHKMPFWQKVRPWFSHVGQAGLAAGVSLAVIVGVQKYNSTDPIPTEVPAFSTFAIGSMASPVSYGVAPNAEQSNVQDHRRHFAILQDYELQRRLHAEPLDLKEIKKAEVAAPEQNVAVVTN